MLVKDVCIVESNNYKQNENWSYFYYLDTGNLTKNKIDCLQLINNIEDLPSRAKQKVTINDILYSSVRPNQQHYGFIDQHYDNLLVSTGFIILRPIIKKVIPKYLYYYLTQDKITNQLQVIAQNSTSSYPSITKDDLLNLEMDIPSIEKQEKIASILSQIDDQVERNNIMVKKLQVLGKAIYCKNISTSNSEKLSAVSYITTGKEDANHATVNGKYKFFTCSDNISYCDDFKFDGKSILVAGNGNFNVKYYDGKCNAYQRTYVVKKDSIVGNLYYTLLFNTELFKKKANGSIIKFITIEMLNNIDVPTLDDNINSLLNSIVSKINHIEESISNLTLLKNRLLPLLINQQLG